ncbi:MAG TPA: branched-chain amino acid ABC transporter permease [Candidatus Dormibacteraeota bacterium]|nr:branched-chain amino acid ABC transporter permease [Candidatus Dormibacteraeota bacterium]
MTTFFQLFVAGLALGCIYALVALGFTIIYRASQVINFAQGSFLLLGAYLVSWFSLDRSYPFVVAALLALGITVVVGVVFQTVVLRFTVGQPVFTVVMITIGLNIALEGTVPALFGSSTRSIGDPWGSSAVHLGGVVINWDSVWTIGVTLLILVLFFAFNRFSRYGLAMRATAMDEEAAMAVGVPTRRVHALAWGLAGAVATVGGFFLAGFPNSLSPGIDVIALRAFPAIILGGLDSPLGAVVGGVTIGLVEELTAGYQPNDAPWLGANFYSVAPYILMILVLLVRPYGLFGHRPAERA